MTATMRGRAVLVGLFAVTCVACGANEGSDPTGSGSTLGSSAYEQPAEPAYRPQSVPLRGHIVSTIEDRTNLFNQDYTVTARVMNDDTEAGIFTVHVFASYPGNGERMEGTGTVTLAAGQTGEARVDVHGADALQSLRCELIAPTVVR